MVDILPAMAKKLYKVPQVMDLYHKRKTFDLIIVDQLMNEVKRFDFVVHCVILVHETSIIASVYTIHTLVSACTDIHRYHCMKINVYV